VIRADVNQVFVTFSALDSKMRPVEDLQIGEIQLKDDKRPRAIQYFARDVDVPLTIGLVVDMSGSQVKFFDQHRRDVQQFLRQVLQPGDQAFVISVMSEVRLVTDLTGSVETLSDGVEALGRRRPGRLFGDQCGISAGPGGAKGTPCGTALWNGVYSAARLRLKGISGRKAIIVLSDGLDTGSQHSATDAIEAAQSADVPVYTLLSTSSGLVGIKGRRAMNRLADETGGRYYRASQDKIATIFSEIETELRHLYVAAFSLPDTDRDGKFHPLELKTTRSKVKLRARKGYVAEH
jgi:VWFA-related protein